MEKGFQRGQIKGSGKRRVSSGGDEQREEDGEMGENRGKLERERKGRRSTGENNVERGKRDREK